MLGIDVSRHNPVVSWPEVKNADVEFVYVKGTDGGGVAPGTVAPAYVAGAKRAGLSVGLYHYAQLSPSPEAQADILTAEVRKLGAVDLPPALDLEAPWKPGPDARLFTQRFLTRLRANGFTTVTLYASTSMLTGIRADTLGVPGVVIWAANYGPNDGVQHALPVPWKTLTHIHQFTSVGLVGGIRGRVDLNKMLKPMGDDVSAQDVWTGITFPVLNADGTEREEEATPATLLRQNNRAVWMLNAKIDGLSGALSDDEAAIIAEIRAVKDAIPSAGADPAAIAGALAPLLAPLIQTGASPEQVREITDLAVRQAFARAAESGE